jgi:hypothetical protein
LYSARKIDLLKQTVLQVLVDESLVKSHNFYPVVLAPTELPLEARRGGGLPGYAYTDDLAPEKILKVAKIAARIAGSRSPPGRRIPRPAACPQEIP